MGQLAATHGVAVVSGGALGIDAAAHQGALDGGGRTCVVLPSPVHTPLPAGNRPLFGRVLEGHGTLLSEYEVQLGKRGFLERNRLVAALADATVVVEARARSGTERTAREAAGLGRPVLGAAWPGGDLRGEGLRTWAIDAHLVDSPEAAIEAWLMASGVAPASSPPAEPEAPEDGGVLWAALAAPRALDELVPLESDAASRLGEWELLGWVERRGGRYHRSRPSPRSDR